MSLMDGILLTIVNTVACLALPRLLWATVVVMSQIKTSKKPVVQSPESTPVISSYVDVIS